MQGLDSVEWKDLEPTPAGLLYFGIRNDTDDFLSEATTKRDLGAIASLTPLVELKKMRSVIDFPLPQYYFELKKVLTREGNNRIEGSCFCATIGMVTDMKRDSLGMIADEMIRYDGIETSIIFGLVENRLEACVRSQNSSQDVNQLCKRIFGKDNAGGKMQKGAAKLPLDRFFSPSDAPPGPIQDKLWEALKEKTFHTVFQTVSGD